MGEETPFDPTDDELIDRLSRLEYRHIAILFYKMRRLSDWHVAQKWGNGEKWLDKEMTKIYAFLGFPTKMHSSKKDDILKNRVLPLVKVLTDGEEGKLNEFPLIKTTMPDPVEQKPVEQKSRAKPVEQVVDHPLEQKSSAKDIAYEKAEDDYRKFVDRSRQWIGNNRQYLFIAVGVIALLGLLFVVFRLGQNTAQISPTQVPINATQAVVDTLPASTVAVPTEAATNTLPAPTDTPQPTNTQVPSDTSQPTATLSFSPLTIDFSKGLADLGYIQVIYGTFRFVNGEFFSVDRVLLSVGLDDWKNYSVEYESHRDGSCWGHDAHGVAAHAIDVDNLIMFGWNYCGTAWYEWVNGTRNVVDEMDGFAGGAGAVVKIKYVAEDGSFSAYINGRKWGDYIDEKFTKGKIYILMHTDTYIDNIVIRPLP
jgi:hypothetical protein